MNALPVTESKVLHTLMIVCPVCSSDVGETLGVTGRMDGLLTATIVMHCGSCQAVYLSPPPVADVVPLDYDETKVRVYAHPIQRLKQTIPSNSRFLSADSSAESILRRDPADGPFDIVLLPLSLASTRDPNALLGHTAKLLDHHGTIEIVAGNAESSCFRQFGARHWCGYRFPRVQLQLGATAIARLARNAGLKVERLRTESAPQSWLLSLRNWLIDWGAGRVVVVLLTGPWLMPWLVAYVCEFIAKLRGKASVLVVQLRKS